MSQTRIYLPLTAADVQTLAGSGEVVPSGAYAVTPALRSDLPAADEEEREFVAMSDAVAAAGALRRSADRGAGAARRVVAAADLESAVVIVSPARPGQARSLVRLQGPVPLRRIVSFHLDEHPDGDGDLLWYDVTELAEVSSLLR